MAPESSAGEEAPPSKAWLSTGPRHTLAALRRAVLHDRESIRARPALLARPLRIVVPSHALKRNLLSTLSADAGGSLLGVAIETAGDIVEQTLARRPSPFQSAGPFFDLFVDRLAGAAGSGLPGLAGFEKATAPLARSCRDALSAGLSEQNLDAALHALRDIEGAAGDRARATLRLAVQADGLLRTHGLERKGARAVRAARMLREQPDILPSRGIWIAGFADAPGGTRRLLSALLWRPGTNIIFDNPEAPSGPGPFVARFARLLRVEPAPLPGSPEPPGVREAFVALRPGHEIEEIARRIRTLIDQGVQPESIAVVARSTAPYLPAIRDHFGRHAIPFSGGRLDPAATPRGRAAAALLELLGRGPSARIERWISGTDENSRLVRVAFQSLGLVSIADLAAADFEAVAQGKLHWVLPLRAPRGAAAPNDEDGDAVTEEERDDDATSGSDEEAPSSPARTQSVPVARLSLFAQVAANFSQAYSGWTDDLPVSGHADAFCSLLQLAAPWRSAGDIHELPDRARAVAASAPAGLSVSRAEFLRLVETEWSLRAAIPAGGAGGGVAVLDAMRARGVPFEHVFLAGAAAGQYPAASRTDAFLPDEARLKLQALLPDLSAAILRPAEENWLFAELAAAATRTTWSWPRTDAQGRAVRPSSLALRKLPADSVPPREAPEFPAEPDRDGTLRDLARTRALAGDRDAAQAWLGALLETTSPRAAADSETRQQCDARPLARARFDALRLFEPLRDAALASGNAPGPWTLLGLTGTGEDDRNLYVTALESVVVCPWQAFLRRVLRIEPLPDPLRDAPDVQPLTLGRVVHGVLEDLLAHPENPRDLPAALRSRPHGIARPGIDQIRKLAAEKARSAGVEDGLYLPGLQRALALRAESYVERALDFLFPHALEVASLGAELEGTLAVEDLDGRPGSLRFRADFVLLKDGGGVRLIDWKSGRRAERKKPIATRLQAAAYARGDGLPPHSEGAYVYLKAGERQIDIVLVADRTDPDEETVFRYATRGALSAWRLGFWFPRLSSTNGSRPGACSRCEVKDACHQGDTDVKLRYEALAQAADAAQTSGNAGMAARILAHLHPAAHPPDLDAATGTVKSKPSRRSRG